ncbi:MAG: LysR family transcriptional regulator [Cocleimonas sp.]
MSGLDPNQTQYLSLAIKVGTIRGAAELLGVEPSTVSRQISALEKQLGTTLIERGRKGVRLTEAGDLLAAYLRRQNGELESLQSEFSALQQLQRGTISLSVGEGFIGDLVSTALALFSKEHPGITYNITYGSTKQVMHDVKTDRAHIGLAYDAIPDKQIKTLTQVKQPLRLLIAPHSQYAKLQEPLDIKELTKIPCAILNRGMGIGTLLNRIEGLHNIQFNAVVKTNSIAVLKNFVREDMGVTFLPEFVVVREILDKQIIAKKITVPEFSLGESHLIVRQGRRLPDAAISLTSYLQQHMSTYKKK